jgi:large conductance mechanosensitive channel
MLTEFADFIREKGVLGLAVGIITGSAVTKTVTSIVDNLISPLIGAITGAAGALTDLSWGIPFTGVTLKYGAVISSIIDLVAVMFVVYLVFVKSPLNKIDKKKQP